MATMTPERLAAMQAGRLKAGPRPSRRAKMAAYSETFATQRREFPAIALPLIDQAEGGSLTAAVKLMCLDCTCWQRAEIRDCTIARCPLYPHRPYQSQEDVESQS